MTGWRNVLAVGLGAVALVEIGVGVAAGAGGFFSFAGLAVSLAVVGSLLAVRRPANPIGWLLAVWSVTTGFTCMVGALSSLALTGSGTEPVALRWAAAVVPVVWHPGFCLFMIVCLVFPDGRFLSRRWAWTGAFIVAWYLALAVASALDVTAVRDYVPGTVAPYTSPVQDLAHGAFNILLTGQLFFFFVAVASLAVRWRRTRGDERRRVTVFVLPSSVALLAFLLGIVLLGDGRAGPFLFPVLPIAIAVAVTRYKLYEIDTVVSRSVSYGIVTATVAGVFVGAVQLVGLALPRADSLRVAVATLAAVAVFTPLRRRVQRVVDRRFDRTRHDHERLVDRFRTDLRHADHLDGVGHRLLDAVDTALAPASAGIWVRPQADPHVSWWRASRIRARRMTPAAMRHNTMTSRGIHSPTRNPQPRS